MLLKQKFKQKEIAKLLEVSSSTISREIKRNSRQRTGFRGQDLKTLGEYDSNLANLKSRTRRQSSKWQGMKINNNLELKKYIINKLKKHWSPDEIAGRLKQEKLDFYTSRNSIYRWLYSSRGSKYCQLLYAHRYMVKKYKKNKTKRMLIPHRTSIKERPLVINQKQEIGHFEKRRGRILC